MFASGNRKCWAFSKLSTNSAVTQLSTRKEQDPDVKSACAVTTPLPSNIKVSCRGCWGSNHLTISAIAHSNSSSGNKPSHHNSDWPTLRWISLYSLTAAHRLWSSDWVALLWLLLTSHILQLFLLRCSKETYSPCSVYSPQGLLTVYWNDLTSVTFNSAFTGKLWRCSVFSGTGGLRTL